VGQPPEWRLGLAILPKGEVECNRDAKQSIAL
jgi:hypothetical protein